MLKASILIIGFLVGAALSASIDCNNEQCAKPQKLYEELGCKAFYGARSCCAKRFECPDFKKLDDSKCSFEGKEYKIGETVPRNFTDTTKCVETCFCSREDSGPAKFECVKNDCGVSSFKVPGCINIYGDLNECCSTSIVCDDDEKELLASCFVGKEFREGEKFIPSSNPCYECLCHKEFDNSTIVGNPHCRKLNCEIDLRYKSFVQRGCLPVFHSDKCCPIDWECPNKKISKRSANEIDVYATNSPRQEVFIVTPSKNLEQYLDIVRLANPENNDDYLPVSTTASPTTTTTTDVPATEGSTKSSENIPTLSADPFQAPNEVLTTTPVTVTEEATVGVTESQTTTEVATESTQSSTEEVKTAATEALTTPETTVSIIEATTPAEAVTTTSTEAAKTESDISKESEEAAEKSQNLFGEDVEEEKVPVTVVPSSTEQAATETSSTAAPSTEAPSTAAPSTEAPSTAAPSTEAPSTAAPSTEALKEESSSTEAPSTEALSTESPSTEATKEESSRVLEQPEVPTTVAEATEVPVTTVIESTEKAVTKEEVQTTLPTVVETVVSAVKSEVSINSEPSTTSVPTTEAVQTSKATESSTAPTTSMHVEVEEMTTPKPVVETEISTTIKSESTEAPATVPTFSDNVAPTVFAELLTTLRRFVAKIEATSTVAPVISANEVLSVDVPVTEQIVEYVNFTVTSEKQQEEPKSISKRSVTLEQADLIPRYFKQHYLTSKDKGCIYNARTFKIGEVIETDNECLECLCEIAPIGHCVLKENCSVLSS